MNAKRKKVEAFILEQVQKITPDDDTNVKLLTNDFKALSDQEFEDFIRGLGPATTPEQIAKRQWIPIVVPNLGKTRISIARNYQIARDLGRSIEHRLVMTDPHTGLQYVTPHAYPVLDLPVRRQAQTVAKKRSIPEHNQRVDDLTGQPTSESKGSRISQPELASLSSRGLDNTIMEFINVRGGNAPAYREMRRQLIENGEVTLAQLEGLGTAKSTNTAATLFNCMLIGNNLNPATKVPEDALRPKSTAASTA